MQTKLKKWLKWIVIGSFVALISLVTFIWVSVSMRSSFESKPFNSEVWKNQPDSRYIYVEDLIENNLIKNSTKTEVKELLGQPNTNEPINENDQLTSGRYSHFADTTGSNVDFVYYIGTEPGVLQQIKFLFIWFNNNKVDSLLVRGSY